MNRAELEARQEIYRNEFTPDLELPCADCGKDSDAHTEVLNTDGSHDCWLCETCGDEQQPDKLKNIMAWMPERWTYIGQALSLKTRAWYLVSRDDHNYPGKHLLVTKLLGDEYGTPSGPSQPRTHEQLARLYGPIIHTWVAIK